MEAGGVFLPRPPDWSLGLGIAGRCFIWAAIAAFVLCAASWLLAPRAPLLERAGKAGFTAGACCLFGAFIVLGILFVNNRLEFEYVWQHGDGSNSLPYRIAAIWSGQQGSFLLWACTSALFGLFSVRGTGGYRRWFTVAYACFLGSIAGILAYETPFGLNLLNGTPVVPPSGIGLAPALINYWVIVHPPTIFMGFGSLTVLAAYAFSAMVSRNYADWIAMVRPWAIVSLTLVGVGLCMGGFWAYETLGWGGFWMWDPVENVSFVPWVMTIAFVHGILVQVAKKGWIAANLLMGGLPFLLFVYGTFLTRSGILGDTSVHSFAEMDRIALKVLLGFLIVSCTVFLTLWTVRTVQLMRTSREAEDLPAGLHREGFHRAGNIFLIVLGLGAAFGMSVPLIMTLMGQKPKVVEEAVYHELLTWAYIPLMIAMAIGPLMSWRGMGWIEFGKRVFGVFCVTVMFAGFAMIAFAISPWERALGTEQTVSLPFHLLLKDTVWVTFLLSLSFAVIVASAWRISELFKRSKMSAAAYLAHIGLAVLMAGLVISRGLEQKTGALVLQPGVSEHGLGYLVTYEGQTSNTNDRNNEALFRLEKGRQSFVAKPIFYNTKNADGETEPVTRPYIKHTPLYDIYVALQRPQPLEGSITIPLHETVTIDKYIVTYERMVHQGNFGAPGSRFGAVLLVKDATTEQVLDEIEPSLQLTNGGMQQSPVDLGSGVKVSLGQIDAATNSIALSVEFEDAAFPIQVFYKPMTILVWLGTGIMALGGLLSAYYRRRPKRPAEG